MGSTDDEIDAGLGSGIVALGLMAIVGAICPCILLFAGGVCCYFISINTYLARRARKDLFNDLEKSTMLYTPIILLLIGITLHLIMLCVFW